VTGIRGQPPPPTTKLAIFYRGGYQSQFLANACGYATDEKWALYEAQIRYGLKKRSILDDFEVLEFQVVGIKETDPSSQLRSTTYCRIFSQATSEATILGLLKTLGEFGMQHFSGTVKLKSSVTKFGFCSADSAPPGRFSSVIGLENSTSSSLCCFLSGDNSSG
jgi:hypothetical protein